MDARDEQKIRAVEKWPRHAGKSDYLKFLNGVRLTQRESIKAMCFSCDPEGTELCCVQYCPLRPYNELIREREPSGSACTVTHSNLLTELKG